MTVHIVSGRLSRQEMIATGQNQVEIPPHTRHLVSDGIRTDSVHLVLTVCNRNEVIKNPGKCRISGE